MNDRGEFFTGVTKISAATGEEEVIGAPIVTTSVMTLSPN